MPRTIQQIEADIAAVKDNNPDWITNTAALISIAAYTNERTQLQAQSQGK